MKKATAILLVLMIFLCLAACESKEPVTAASCGHEAYLDLMEMLEKKDYTSARAYIDALEGKNTELPEETTLPTVAATQPEETKPAETEPGVVDTNVLEIELDRYCFLDYFEIRDDLIFEDPVICYQNIQPREEYRSRLVDIRNLKVEISFFDAKAHGELDRRDQLFFSDHYTMATGDLDFQNVEFGKTGEGHLNLSTYDSKNGCFDHYMMDIAIREATGTLLLAKEE